MASRGDVYLLSLKEQTGHGVPEPQAEQWEHSSKFIGNQVTWISKCCFSRPDRTEVVATHARKGSIY